MHSKKKKARRHAAAERLATALGGSEAFPLGEDRNVGTLKLKGRLYRSPRRGHLILQRTGSCCEGVAVEMPEDAVEDIDLAFEDSAGRRTYVVSVSAGCPVGLVVPTAEPRDRPVANQPHEYPSMVAWQAAPWRAQPARASSLGGYVEPTGYANHDPYQVGYSAQQANPTVVDPSTES